MITKAAIVNNDYIVSKKSNISMTIKFLLIVMYFNVSNGGLSR